MGSSGIDGKIKNAIYGHKQNSLVRASIVSLEEFAFCPLFPLCSKFYSRITPVLAVIMHLLAFVNTRSFQPLLLGQQCQQAKDNWASRI